MPDTEEQKGKIEDIFDSWITDILSSGLGTALIIYGFAGDILFSVRAICVLLGVIMQMPLVYFKIYQSIFGE